MLELVGETSSTLNYTFTADAEDPAINVKVKSQSSRLLKFRRVPNTTPAVPADLKGDFGSYSVKYQPRSFLTSATRQHELAVEVYLKDKVTYIKNERTQDLLSSLSSSAAWWIDSAVV
jgi:hypothetical protein